MPAYREWVLPAHEFHGSWQALYYDTEIKQRLLRFATSALQFADAGVNQQLISWNRWGRGSRHAAEHLKLA